MVEKSRTLTWICRRCGGTQTVWLGGLGGDFADATHFSICDQCLDAIQQTVKNQCCRVPRERRRPPGILAAIALALALDSPIHAESPRDCRT